ncbi:HlyD family secretion protein [Rhodovarius crocodyli]|uniref:HlyD family secretion protein n=1 Tax=Rhodovarius crocodyli TaxID=1979269 RepID=A0A437MIY3_9PROT|nr:HlyD family secretion protein [Rhodovarius crocodyli]RVT97591.1 HlyD family secretion protein [Rhodovarius crocodyli]
MPDALPPPSKTAPGKPAQAEKKRSPLRTALIAVVLLGAAAGGGWWWYSGLGWETTDNAYLAGDISPLSARIEGDVAEIMVADNAPVTAGQPLIRLEDADWRARRDAAAATVADAEASIQTLNAQLGQSRAQLVAAEAAVAQADAARVLAVQEASRFGTLASSGVGSRERAEQTLAERRRAEAAQAAADAQRLAAAAAIPVIEAQTRSAEAKLEQARANLVLAENNLSYTVIRAPFDGFAANRAAQLGQHVRAGQSLIAVTPPPARQWLVANFKETQLARIRPGQRADITLDVGDQRLHGRVESLAGATGALFSLLPPENATGNFTRIVQRVPVRIEILDPPAGLRPGLSARVSVEVGR